MQKSVQQSTQLQRFSASDWRKQSDQRKLIVEEAKSWIGTPYRHQGRSRSTGCDCIGLVIGIARKFGFDKNADFEDILGYSKNPDGIMMSKGMIKYLTKVDIHKILPGDILHLSFLQHPQHVVMLMLDDFIIHAHEPDNRVIYHRMDNWWFSRIAGAYKFKGLN